MKVSYIVPGLGTCALLMFSSCRSTDGDKYSETALPMSEMSVADGEIPPWILEDYSTNGAQVSAGSYTPGLASADVRNQYPTPEPGETSSRGRTRQNQPPLGNEDSTHVEPGNYIEPQIPDYPVDTPQDTKPSGSQGSSGKKIVSTGGKKRGTKPTQPTMVTYKVRPGDNLSVIAARSNTTVSQIMKDSKLKSTTIYPGQTIKVRFTPKGYKAPAKGSKGASSAGSSGKTHTVTSGQTLSGIAAKYGVSTSKLMKANGLTEASARKIRPGQKLKIPSKR